MEAPSHQELMRQGIEAEGGAYRALLGGRDDEARELLQAATRSYLASWEVAPEGSWGRLVAALKAAVIAGDAADVAARVRGQTGEAPTSPVALYALATAALVQGDDGVAARAAEGMRAGGDAFARAADALAALAARDRDAYAEAVAAIVADFAAREAHLTGVPVADTAILVERLAEARGMAARPRSPLMPAA